MTWRKKKRKLLPHPARLQHPTPHRYLDYWPLSPHSLIDITSLRELRVSHFQDTIPIEKLLLTVEGSLEHFHLKPGYWDGKKLFFLSLLNSFWFFFLGAKIFFLFFSKKKDWVG